MTPEQTLQLAHQQRAAGNFIEAEKLYRTAAEARPDDPAILSGLGALFCQAGRWEEAIAPFHRVVTLRPDLAQAHHNLGNVYRNLGNTDDAIQYFSRAISLRPKLVETLMMLGNTLFGVGRLAEAVSCFSRASALRPDQAEIRSNLGAALYQMGKLTEAAAQLRHAARLMPQSAEIHNNLAAVLYRKNELDDAESAARRGIGLRDNFASAWANLAAILQAMGNIHEAICCFDRAVELNPSDQAAASSLIMATQLDPAYDSQRLLAAVKLWDQHFGAPLRAGVIPHEPMSRKGRRLRIGYVSADFRDQVIGRNVLPLFRHHDRNEFEVFCYSSAAWPDAITRQFKELADHRRDIARLGDAAAAELIRADGIDLLVDLSLHTPENRLPIFARKPAPVQATFAGYPGGTGLSAMDWRLTDPHLDPPGQTNADYVEQSYRLPDSFWCYDPPAMEADGLQVGPPPVARNGYVTFGCLNSFCKISDRVIPLWSRLLKAVPTSRLLILAPPGGPRRAIREKLHIEPDRLEFVSHQPRKAHLATFNRIDISLDTLPYNGHTTSLESLWMGVPVLTLVGSTVVGRAGVSQLSNLGLTELIARDDEQFLTLATQLAADLPRLAALRSTLRQRMLQSPLCNGKQFARNIEEAYRRIVNSPSR